jgi:hypothetical protein
MKPPALSKNRGFLLIFALLLTVLISLISLSLLQLRKSGYISSQAALKNVQARALARSGMGDCWVKISKDPHFPSGIGDEQVRFSYRQRVEQAGRPIGSFSVTVDRTYRISHEVLLVESTGIVGGLENSTSVYSISAEIVIKEGSFGIRNWQEGVTPSL